MSALQLVVCALAVWQATEIWHHGKVFQKMREELQAVASTDNGIRGFLAYGLLCPFCISVWFGFLFSVVLLNTETVPTEMLVFVYGLAACRLAQLGNDLSYESCRSPKDGSDDPTSL